MFSLRVFQLELLLNRAALPMAVMSREDRKAALACAFSGTARTSGKSMGLDVFLYMPFLTGGYPSPLMSWGNQLSSAVSDSQRQKLPPY